MTRKVLPEPMQDRFREPGSAEANRAVVPPLLPEATGTGDATDRDPAVGTAEVRRKRRGWWVGGLLAVGLIGLLVLAHFPPDRHGFYPRCSWYASTGLLCPGCGSFRALHLLTQGDWMGALRSNLLLTAGVPLLALLWAAGRWGGWKRVESSRLAGWTGWLALALVLVFGLLRNLPGAFARWLAP